MRRTTLAIAAATFLLTTGEAGAICLTKQEARTLWPKQHLYWYSKDRCWSNRRGPPKNLKIDPLPKAALAAAQTPPAAVPLPKPAPRKLWKETELPDCCWPDLQLPSIISKENDK